MSAATRTVVISAAALLVLLLGLLGFRLVYRFGTTDTLVEAAGRGDQARVRAVLAPGLLSKVFGVNPDLRAPNGPAALMNAAAAGHAGVVRELLVRGADVRARDGRGDTALKIARRAGHTNIVALLRQAGAKE